MQQFHNLYFGWCGGEKRTSITEVALDFPELIKDFVYATITCVDGNRYDWLHTTFPPYAEEKGILSYQLVADGVLISGLTLYGIAEDESFLSGFDEVWFFNEFPKQSLPITLSLTSELPILDPRSVQQKAAIAAWMAESHCVLGLGDGSGLNFATSLKDVAEQLMLNKY